MAQPNFPVHLERMPQTSICQGIPVREDVLFSNKNGVEKPRLRKRADQILGRLAEPLKRILEPGEVVLYCVQACGPMSVWEQFIASWWSYSMRRAMLVITNKRIAQFSVQRSNTWKRNLRVMAWGDIQKAKANGLISCQLILEYGNKKKETFLGISPTETGKLRALLRALQPASTTEGTAAQGPVSLCPDCYKPLTPRVYACGSCGLVFKNEKTLVLMGLFVPGGRLFLRRLSTFRRPHRGRRGVSITGTWHLDSCKGSGTRESRGCEPCHRRGFVCDHFRPRNTHHARALPDANTQLHPDRQEAASSGNSFLLDHFRPEILVGMREAVGWDLIQLRPGGPSPVDPIK